MRHGVTPGFRRIGGHLSRATIGSGSGRMVDRGPGTVARARSGARTVLASDAGGRRGLLSTASDWAEIVDPNN
jgi:hypothetical protein